jgi:hypothetical protein
MKTQILNHEVETTYTVITNPETKKPERIRYFVSNIPSELNEKFAGWVNLGWGKFSKDAYVKTDIVAIIAELKEIGINC